MDSKYARYKKLEAVLTAVLCVDAALFLAYMIFAGLGITAVKITVAVLSFILSGGVLYILFLTRELLRRRSIWMTLAAACIILCTLVSMILNFPAPAVLPVA